MDQMVTTPPPIMKVMIGGNKRPIQKGSPNDTSMVPMTLKNEEIVKIAFLYSSFSAFRGSILIVRKEFPNSCGTIALYSSLHVNKDELGAQR